MDHSRRLYRSLYQPDGSFPEYEQEAKRRFADDALIQFVQGLRNYCLHYRTPGITTTTTVIDFEKEAFLRQVSLSKSDLLNFEWNSAAKRFLDHAPPSIDLREVLTSYHASIEDFYDWFSTHVQRIHSADYEKVSRVYAVLLSAKSEEHLASLEERTMAFEAGLGSPYDVLNPFMTAKDAAEISSLLRDMENWVVAAIERVSKYLSVSPDTAARIQAAWRRIGTEAKNSTAGR